MSQPAAIKRRAALEAERDSLILEREIQILKESEKQSLRETVGDYIDPRWILQDPALNASALAPASYIGDRRGGQNWPIFRTEWELNTIRGTCRLLADTSSDSQGVIEALTNYVVGKGFTYKVVPKPDMTVGPRTIKKAQRVIAEFVDENDYWDLERELFRRDLRDGEDFLHVYPLDAGHAKAETIEPEYVTEAGRAYPLGTAATLSDTRDPDESWMFGIHTVSEDSTDVLGYNAYLDTLYAAEYLSKEEVIHTKCNVDRIIKRGLSDFYPLTQTIDQARKLRRNMADGAALQASIAFIRQFQKGTQQSAIQAFNTQKTDFTTARYSINQPQATSNVQRMDSGRIINTPEGTQYLYGPMGNSNSPNFQLVLQVVLRAIAVRWNAPEGLISGDYSNNAFASALVAEAPFALTVAHRQQQQGNRHRKVMLKILKIAALSGRFNRLGLDWYDLKHLIDVQCVPTAAIGRDKNQETERRAKLNAAKIISTDTWRAEEGYDEAEKEKVEAETQEKQTDPQAAIADQPVPGVTGKGGGGQGGQGGNGSRYLGGQPKRPEAQGMKGQMPWLGEGSNPIPALEKAGRKLSKQGVMPGYGQIFVKVNGSGEAWYVGGDGDESGFGDLVKETLLKIEGIDDVEYADEGSPPKDEGWIQVYPKRREWITAPVREAEEIVRPPRGSDGLFVQPDDNTPERERAEQHNRERFANHFHYADTLQGNPRTYDPAGNYNCGRCNMANGDGCLLVHDLKINYAAGSCGDWENICAGDSEMPLGEKTIETAGYGVAANGEGFGCHRCPFASRAYEPDSQGRELYCGKGDFRVFPLACCGLNGAQTLPMDEDGNVTGTTESASNGEAGPDGLGVQESFPGHAGRPGHRGGSAPGKGGGGSGSSSERIEHLKTKILTQGGHSLSPEEKAEVEAHDKAERKSKAEAVSSQADAANFPKLAGASRAIVTIGKRSQEHPSGDTEVWMHTKRDKRGRTVYSADHGKTWQSTPSGAAMVSKSPPPAVGSAQQDAGHGQEIHPSKLEDLSHGDEVVVHSGEKGPSLPVAHYKVDKGPGGIAFINQFDNREDRSKARTADFVRAMAKEFGGKLLHFPAAVASIPDNIASGVNRASSAVINARRKIDPFDHERPMGESEESQVAAALVSESTSRACLLASLSNAEIPEAARAVLKDFVGTE